MRARLIVLLAVSALALTACGGGSAVQDRTVHPIDINPHPRDQIRDGGTLRLPIDIFPNNYNYNQVDGTNSDILAITEATLPYQFTTMPDGGVVLNHDYLTSAVLTSTAPQVVTYTINPKATWSDGTPFSWRDFESYWKSLNGSNPAYLVSGTVGYQDITSVTRGVDDKQAVVTFGKPFAEWQGLFSPFAPSSLTSTPEAFNTAWKSTLPVTAGPFTIDSIDQTRKTVTLKRDPKWWGTPAKLDRIIFTQYEQSAQADALANNELDYYEIGADLNLLRRAQTTPGAVVRDAPSQYSYQVTMNGAGGALLSDLPLRQAVVQGIDRTAITKQMIGQIEPDAKPNGNHLYNPGSKYYQDHAGELPFDRAKAEQTLDSLGWVRAGAGRQKDGKQLTLRLVFGESPTNQDIAKAIQNQLAQIGVTVELHQLGVAELFPNITTGNFDLAFFGWGTTSSPLSSSVNIYGSPIGDNVRENYGRIGTPEIDALYDQGITQLDDTKRAEIGNRIDKLVWQQAHSVMIYTRPGAVAVRGNLANFGTFGLADRNYIDAGFLK
ncbi:ABC transporter family substrate-binding protein [Pseudonocardia spinosispora]|uniref:ABC transporter family substrate-binding protein n=1 Tax=Pseudonocardia spinosispora TaxID=103441 RepID=UPI00040C8BEA|nr:ABC transporter family substrate-binding protein [Pseudonocardia spinosispora]